MRLLKNKNGFTLVVLLVVLAIVGVLMGLAVGGIRIVQQVNRDTQRKALVRDIQLTLESYQERNNKYPTGTGAANGVTLSNTDPDCEGVLITAGGSEEVCSKVNFAPQWQFDNCGGYPKDTASEEESGNITGCYAGHTRAYNLYIMLERTIEDYNAGNV